MGLNINIDQVDEMKSDINKIFSNSSISYEEITGLLSNISSDWSTEGSEAFIERFKDLTDTFDNYTESLKNIVNYLTDTEEEYDETTSAVKDIIG